MSAEGKMTAARTSLVLDQPFFGTLALGLHIQADPGCGTAWVDGRTLGYDPTFIDGLKHEEVTALIAHEVMHCALGHPWRRDGRDFKRWNIACLAERTPVLMADGSHKAIEDITIGESVWSPEGPSRVLGVKFSGMERCVNLSYNGSSLWCTGNHTILTMKGTIHAASAEGYRGIYSKAAGQSRSTSVHPSQLSDNGAFGPVFEYEGSLLEHSAVPPVTRSLRGQAYTEALQHSISAKALRLGTRLFSGDDRRGWQHNRGINGAVHPSRGIGPQHIISALAMAQAARILRNLSEEFLGACVLPYVLDWSPSGSAIALDPALFGGQGTTGGFTLGAYRASQESTSQRSADGAYAADCLRDSDFKQTRIKIGGWSEECWPVYDIVTEKQFIVAAGLVVHNCDKAINHDLRESGFKLPDDGYYAEGDEKGKSSEWIFARMGDDDGDGPGGGQGQGNPGNDGQPQPGNGPGTPDPLGEVRDAPNGPDADTGEPAPSEQDWKQKTAAAAQQAKMRGTLPGSMARLVSQALKPKVDIRSLLLRFFSERSTGDYSWTRPNPRYIAQGLYLPALESRTLGEIAILADTSGSMDEVALAYTRGIVEQVLDEVAPAGVTLYMVDTRVHTVHRMERGEPLTWEPKGGGGTNFTSFFERVESGEYPEPVCIIGITDLCATFGTAPAAPVLWLATEEGTAPFGEVVLVDR